MRTVAIFIDGFTVQVDYELTNAVR